MAEIIQTTVTQVIPMDDNDEIPTGKKYQHQQSPLPSQLGNHYRSTETTPLMASAPAAEPINNPVYPEKRGGTADLYSRAVNQPTDVYTKAANASLLDTIKNTAESLRETVAPSVTSTTATAQHLTESLTGMATSLAHTAAHAVEVIEERAANAVHSVFGKDPSEIAHDATIKSRELGDNAYSGLQNATVASKQYGDSTLQSAKETWSHLPTASEVIHSTAEGANQAIDAIKHVISDAADTVQNSHLLERSLPLDDLSDATRNVQSNIRSDKIILNEDRSPSMIENSNFVPVHHDQSDLFIHGRGIPLSPSTSTGKEHLPSTKRDNQPTTSHYSRSHPRDGGPQLYEATRAPEFANLNVSNREDISPMKSSSAPISHSTSVGHEIPQSSGVDSYGDDAKDIQSPQFSNHLQEPAQKSSSATGMSEPYHNLNSTNPYIISAIQKNTDVASSSTGSSFGKDNKFSGHLPTTSISDFNTNSPITTDPYLLASLEQQGRNRQSNAPYGSKSRMAEPSNQYDENVENYPTRDSGARRGSRVGLEDEYPQSNVYRAYSSQYDSPDSATNASNYLPGAHQNIQPSYLVGNPIRREDSYASSTSSSSVDDHLNTPSGASHLVDPGAHELDTQPLEEAIHLPPSSRNATQRLAAEAGGMREVPSSTNQSKDSIGRPPKDGFVADDYHHAREGNNQAGNSHAVRTFPLPGPATDSSLTSKSTNGSNNYPTQANTHIPPSQSVASNVPSSALPADESISSMERHPPSSDASTRSHRPNSPKLGNAPLSSGSSVQRNNNVDEHPSASKVSPVVPPKTTTPHSTSYAGSPRYSGVYDQQHPTMLTAQNNDNAKMGQGEPTLATASHALQLPTKDRADYAPNTSSHVLPTSGGLMAAPSSPVHHADSRGDSPPRTSYETSRTGGTTNSNGNGRKNSIGTKLEHVVGVAEKSVGKMMHSEKLQLKGRKHIEHANRIAPAAL